MTIDYDHDRFHGMLIFQLLVEMVIVMVKSHSSLVSRLICKLLFLNYLLIADLRYQDFQYCSLHIKGRCARLLR